MRLTVVTVPARSLRAAVSAATVAVTCAVGLGAGIAGAATTPPVTITGSTPSPTVPGVPVPPLPTSTSPTVQPSTPRPSTTTSAQPTRTRPAPQSTTPPRPSATRTTPTSKAPTKKPTKTATKTTSSTTSTASSTSATPTPPPPPPIPQDASATVKAQGRPWGVDTAVWQHPKGASINWAAVAKAKPGGASFVFIKTSQGTSAASNPHAAADRAAASKAGVLVGAYHYAVPSRPVKATALAQARFAVQSAGGRAKAGSLPLALDLESNPSKLTPQEMAQWGLTFLAEAKRLSGRTPLLYTYPVFFSASVAPDPAFAAYPLWVANYGLNLNSPTVPAPWTTWTFWQFSAKGRTQGIVSDVDLNVFAGSMTELRLLAGRLPTGKGAARGLPVTAPLLGNALLAGVQS